jgi:nucleotide-binding universal stress UspA family protein
MKRILIPTDFSQNAFNALTYAVNLFAGEDCTFFLLNTYTPVIYDSEYMLNSYSSPDLTESYKNNSEQNLERLKNRISKNINIDQHHIVTVSSFNNLSEEIKEQVVKKNIDLVVMGTKGATGAREILFGSNTVYAMQKVTCPLLAIPSNYEYKYPENILFPSDFGIDFSASPLQIVLDFVHKKACRLDILNVDFGMSLSEYQIQQKSFLREYFKDEDIQFHSISGKSVPEAVNKFQEDHPADLLVMVNNKHSFFENLLFRPVVNQIGFHIKIPFLVLPACYKAKDAHNNTDNSQNYHSTIQKIL